MRMKTLIQIMKRELIRIADRKTLYLMSIVLPIIVFSIYALIYKEEIIREIPVAIFDQDNSAISQKIIEQVESSSSLRIVKYDFSIDEIKNDFYEGKIQAAFFIPKNFEIDIKSGKSSSVVVYKNSSNLIISNIILKDASTIIKTVSGSVLLKKIRSKGNNYSKAMDIVNPIRLETAVLYNPNYSYSNYLVPGLIGFTLQLLIMICSVLVFSSEFTHETFGELILASNNDATAIILGKMIPHFLIHFANILLIVGILFPIFNIKIYGSILTLIFLYALFVLASLTIALAISSIIHDQQFATEIAVFYNTPAFIFSGFTFPLWAMPAVHSAIAQIMPFTHFLTASIKAMQMNLTISYMKNEIIALSLFVIFSVAVIYLAINYQIKKYSRVSEASL